MTSPPPFAVSAQRPTPRAQPPVSSPRPLGRLLPRIRPYLWRLTIAFVCLLASASIALAFPQIVRHLLDAAFISARTGNGLAQLRTTIESFLPRPEIEIRALVPYERGDLVNRIHQTGEFLATEHRADGTLVAARVSPALAAELAPYELVTSDTVKLD